MLLDNEKGETAVPVLGKSREPVPDRKRAVLVGQVWSADLAETLMDVYSHLFAEGCTLEDVSRFVQDLDDDSPGD